jgi:phospholipid/cholesterol/gamma-HCH transport system permease protein
LLHIKARRAILSGTAVQIRMPIPMPSPAAPALNAALHAGRLQLAAAGAWTAIHAAALEGLVQSAPVAGENARSIEIDLAGVRELDTFGAWLLERLARACRDAGREANFIAVPDRYRGLLDEMTQVNREPRSAGAGPNPLAGSLDRLGRTIARSRYEAAFFLAMLGALGASLFRVLLRPTAFRLTSAVHQLDRVGWQAVGIIVLITFLIGGIIAQQGFFHFRKFGADDYVVDLVAILVVREIGVLIVAIMVAGRSGSSYTAELGSMKMREEIDALRTMGLDPVDVLMLPRVLALVCALPILTFIGNLSALYGGGLVAWLYGGMSPEIYIARLQDAVSLTHFKVGMIKAPFMALVIGVVACSEGLRVKGSAESLGLRTTSAVVISIFLVIVLDGLFAVFFASIGM